MLNQFRIPKTGFPLGFWFAQQGSIYIFVVLIFAYVYLMQKLDKTISEEEAESELNQLQTFITDLKVLYNDKRIKKVEPTTTPVISPKFSNIFGNTSKIKPGPPCVSIPDEKTKGKIIRPDRKAIPTSATVINAAEFTILSLSLIHI